MKSREEIWDLVEEEIVRLAPGWRLAVLRTEDGNTFTRPFLGPVDFRGAEVIGVFTGLEDFYVHTHCTREELGLPEEAESLVSPREVVERYEEELLSAYRELYLQGEI